VKMKYTFEIMDMGDVQCAVPVGSSSQKLHAVLQLNDVGAKMLKYIAENDTPEAVFEKLCADFPEDDREDIGQKLCDFLNQLTKEGLLLP